MAHPLAVPSPATTCLQLWPSPSVRSSRQGSAVGLNWAASLQPTLLLQAAVSATVVYLKLWYIHKIYPCVSICRYMYVCMYLHGDIQIDIDIYSLPLSPKPESRPKLFFAIRSYFLIRIFWPSSLGGLAVQFFNFSVRNIWKQHGFCSPQIKLKSGGMESGHEVSPFVSGEW